MTGGAKACNAPTINNLTPPWPSRRTAARLPLDNTKEVTPKGLPTSSASTATRPPTPCTKTAGLRVRNRRNLQPR